MKLIKRCVKSFVSDSYKTYLKDHEYPTELIGEFLFVRNGNHVEKFINDDVKLYFAPILLASYDEQMKLDL